LKKRKKNIKAAKKKKKKKKKSPQKKKKKKKKKSVTKFTIFTIIHFTLAKNSLGKRIQEGRDSRWLFIFLFYS
jgi:hypothetical protein